MKLKDILNRINVWQDWQDKYKFYVPRFIDEAMNRISWMDWDPKIFNEYFEKSADQCISSMKQGYFSNAEKEKIKFDWNRISHLLKRIAENQDIPLFDTYDELKNEILQYTDYNKDAAINRLVAGLQPKLLSTIVVSKHLDELYTTLKLYGLAEIEGYQNNNWFKNSNSILKLFKDVKPEHNTYDLATYPWQTLEYLRNNDINDIKMEIEQEKLISLLKYKKQIILQGPPGTGKTKLAEELAMSLTWFPQKNVQSLEISDNDIITSLKGVDKITTVAGNVTYDIISIDETTKTVTLKKSTGTDAPISFSKIQELYREKYWEKKIENNDVRRATAIGWYIYKIRESITAMEDSEQYQLIQFHPSYSYEDFVRGIVSKPNENGNGILYEAENKVLGRFAEKAHRNYIESQGKVDSSKSYSGFDSLFKEFINSIEEKLIDNNHKIPITPKLNITEVKKDAFRIKSDGWEGDNLKYSQIKKLYQYGITNKEQLAKYPDIVKTVYHRTSYYFPVVAMFQNFLIDYKTPVTETKMTPLKNYVLIIDEINRANLSSVLGELIYALEYRGKKVESMYAVDDDTELILPPNLFIIGTMNTADRSVGHIDYAIRRRFAFVDVMPKDLSDELGEKFRKDLFDRVAALFTTNLSPEFEKKDVQLGHSYFIEKADGGSMDIRLEFEIKPILREYVKDGILIGDNIKAIVEDLRA